MSSIRKLATKRSPVFRVETWDLRKGSLEPSLFGQPYSQINNIAWIVSEVSSVLSVW